jgi:hypothetical protein
MRGFVATIFALTLAVAGAVPVEANQGTVCRFDWEVLISPGLSMNPSSGTHRSAGPGTVDCDGLVNGKQPTGTGILEQEGLYGTTDPDSCMGGEGDGIDKLTIPTLGGIETVLSDFTFTFGGKLPTHGGVGAGEFKGTRFSGSFEITPIEGNCITAPVTKARVFGEGVIHG